MRKTFLLITLEMRPHLLPQKIAISHSPAGCLILVVILPVQMPQNICLALTLSDSALPAGVSANFDVSTGR